MTKRPSALDDAASAALSDKIFIAKAAGDELATATQILADVPNLTEKAAPVAADQVLVWDSEAADVLKRVQTGNLPGSGDMTAAVYDAAGITEQLVGLVAAQNLTNKTLTSPILVTPALGTPASGVLTSCTGLPISTGVSGLGASVATFLATPSSANLLAAVTNETGTGALVFATSPTLVTPALGTPASGVLTSCTGLPISTGVTGLGANVATFLATPSSANLASAVTGETGTGALVFATSPTLVTPALGTPASGVLTNATGYPGDASLVTTGALNSGSITSGFGSIDVGASAITTTGAGSFGNANLTGDIIFTERADHASTPGAGFGYLWTKNTVPSTLIFTDDAGTDTTLSTGSGDVSKVGTPVDSQIGVWTGDGTIEGDVDFTFDTATNTFALGGIAGTSIMSVGGVNVLVDSPRGTMTLSNIDALDATTEATIEAAIDTLTSVSLVTPALGTPTSGNLTTCTGYEGSAILSTGEAGGTKFLREDGDGTCSWQTPAGSGDVVGPGSSTDEAIALFDSTTGKLIQNSVVTVNSAASVTTVQSSDATVNIEANAGTAGKLQVKTTSASLLSPDGTDFVVVTDGTVDIQTVSTSRLDATDAGIRLGAANARVTTVYDAGDGDSSSDTILVTPNWIKSFATVGGTDVLVADGGTGRSTSTTAYGLIAAGTTATGAHQTLAAGATTEILVGGGAAALPVWTTATGTGAPVRATSPTLVTPALGTPASGVLTNCTGLPEAGLADNAVTLAKMAGGTDGNLITFDAAGDPAYVATGTATHVLTSNGAGAAPTFQAVSGGGLSHVAGTDAAVAMAVNSKYIVDMSAWATADRIYSLPSTAAVGDRIGIYVKAGNASYELQIRTTAASNDTIDGVDYDAADFTKLFITGEYMEFECITANTAWACIVDERIVCRGHIKLTATSDVLASGALVAWSTFENGNNSSDYNVGDCLDTTGTIGDVTFRRNGLIQFNWQTGSATSIADGVAIGGLVRGDAGDSAYHKLYQGASSSPRLAGGSQVLVSDGDTQYMAGQITTTSEALSGDLTYLSFYEVLGQ